VETDGAKSGIWLSLKTGSTDRECSATQEPEIAPCVVGSVATKQFLASTKPFSVLMQIS
jgi:hypothetical protein